VTFRPILVITIIVLEAAWLLIAILAYNAELGVRGGFQATATIAIIAVIWAGPAIALVIVGWLIEHGLRLLDRQRLSPPPPPPPEGNPVA
jgi:hypothetical protein